MYLHPMYLMYLYLTQHPLTHTPPTHTHTTHSHTHHTLSHTPPTPHTPPPTHTPPTRSHAHLHSFLKLYEPSFVYLYLQMRSDFCMDYTHPSVAVTSLLLDSSQEKYLGLGIIDMLCQAKTMVGRQAAR